MAKMLKIILVAIATFVVFDAAVYDGVYRIMFVHDCKLLWHAFSNIDWMRSHAQR